MDAATTHIHPRNALPVRTQLGPCHEIIGSSTCLSERTRLYALALVAAATLSCSSGNQHRTKDLPEEATLIYAAHHGEIQFRGIHCDVVDFGDKGVVPIGVIRPLNYEYVRFWKRVYAIAGHSPSQHIIESDHTRSQYVFVPPRKRWGGYVVPLESTGGEVQPLLFDAFSGLPYHTVEAPALALELWKRALLLPSSLTEHDADARIPRLFHGDCTGLVALTSESTTLRGPFGIGLFAAIDCPSEPFGVYGEPRLT